MGFDYSYFHILYTDKYRLYFKILMNSKLKLYVPKYYTHFISLIYLLRSFVLIMKFIYPNFFVEKSNKHFARV